MNKNEIVKEIRRLFKEKERELNRQGMRLAKNFSQADIKLITDVFIDVIAYSLQKEGHVDLSGFGSFSIKEIKPREAVNPNTKKPMYIRRQKNVGFKVGKNLKNAINGRSVR